MGTGSANGMDANSIVCALRELYTLLSPPKKTIQVVNALKSDGTPFPFQDPTPPGLKFWWVQNTGSSTLYIFYAKVSSAAQVPVQAIHVKPGQVFTSDTAPKSIYVSGTSGDTSAGVQGELWYG